MEMEMDMEMELETETEAPGHAGQGSPTLQYDSLLVTSAATLYCQIRSHLSS